jgi:tripartite-type tricarboxylate transporter receptor subunit TctC
MISAPAGTPSVVVTKLRATLNSVLPLDDVHRQTILLGLIPGSASSPEELARFINSEIERWGKVIQQAGLAGSE